MSRDKNNGIYPVNGTECFKNTLAVDSFSFIKHSDGTVVYIWVYVWKISENISIKGYVPVDTPLYMYEEVNPGFVDGVLVGAWDQVYAAIREMKEKDSLVFN